MHTMHAFSIPYPYTSNGILVSIHNLTLLVLVSLKQKICVYYLCGTI